MIKPYPWGTHLLVAKDNKAGRMESLMRKGGGGPYCLSINKSGKGGGLVSIEVVVNICKYICICSVILFLAGFSLGLSKEEGFRYPTSPLISILVMMNIFKTDGMSQQMNVTWFVLILR